MQNNQDTIREAMRMAQTPAGQQLIQMLRSGNSQELKTAMDRVAAGDYAAAKQALSEILNNPEAQKLLRQMGGTNGSNGR